jgi:hypothetical protein
MSNVVHNHLTGLALAFLVGCCSPNAGSPNIKNVDVTLKNTGKTPLTWSQVTLGGYTSSAGNLQPGISATHLFFNRPVTEYATVKYKMRDSDMIAKTVPVLKHVPAGFNGDIAIVFAINPDNGEIDVGIYQWQKVNGDAELIRLNPKAPSVP